MANSFTVITHVLSLNTELSCDKPYIDIGLLIVNETIQTNTIFTATIVFVLFRPYCIGYFSVKYRSMLMVHICQIEAVHIRTSIVTQNAQNWAPSGK
jgi:hypothetical protein